MASKKTLLIVGALSLIAGFEIWLFASKPKVLLDRSLLDTIKMLGTNATLATDRYLSTAKTPTDTKRPSISRAYADDLASHLELLGTAIGNLKDPIAFIKDVRTNQKGMYRLGSKIQDATIIKIILREVILDVNGETASLKMGKPSSSGGTGSNPNTIVSISNNRIIVNKNALLQKKEAVFESIQTLKIRPYTAGGKPSGIMIEGLKEDNILQTAGFHNQDIITSVNNQPVGSYTNALEIMHKMRNQPEIRVSVLRDGSIKELKFSLE